MAPAYRPGKPWRLSQPRHPRRRCHAAPDTHAATPRIHGSLPGPARLLRPLQAPMSRRPHGMLANEARTSAGMLPACTGYEHQPQAPTSRPHLHLKRRAGDMFIGWRVSSTGQTAKVWMSNHAVILVDDDLGARTGTLGFGYDSQVGIWEGVQGGHGWFSPLCEAPLTNHPRILHIPLAGL